jgi:hypothetical protein
MPANCANPLCSTSFRRLAEGKLFRLGTVPPIVSSKVCREEYFWLCHRCSSVMTLRLKEDGTVGAVLFLEAIRGVPVPATFTLAHPQKGLMLCTVNPHLPALSAIFYKIEQQIRMPMNQGLQVIQRELVGTTDFGSRVVPTVQMKEKHRPYSRL